MGYLTKTVAAVLQQWQGLRNDIAAISQVLQDQTNAIREYKDSQHKTDDQAPTLIKAELATPVPIRVETEAKERHPVRDKLKWVAEILGIAAAVVLAFLAYFQWKETQNTVKQLKRQIAMDQRAWLLLDTDVSDTFQMHEGDFAVPISLTNIGKSPAENIHGFIEVDELTQEEVGTSDYGPGKERTNIKAGLIYPQKPHETKAYKWASEKKPVAIDSQRHLQFETGKIVVVIRGKLFYEDIFHVEHWIEFCHAISGNPSSKAGKCVEQNKIDSNDE